MHMLCIVCCCTPAQKMQVDLLNACLPECVCIRRHHCKDAIFARKAPLPWRLCHADNADSLPGPCLGFEHRSVMLC